MSQLRIKFEHKKIFLLFPRKIDNKWEWLTTAVRKTKLMEYELSADMALMAGSGTDFKVVKREYISKKQAFIEML